MSKEVKRWDELKALAEGMDGWPNKAAFECDDVWFVGAIDEDENLYPVIEIQTEHYDAFDASEPMAKYYAAANPPAILALLAERDALLAERDALKKDAERYRLYRQGFEKPEVFDANVDAALQGEQPCT